MFLFIKSIRPLYFMLNNRRCITLKAYNAPADVKSLVESLARRIFPNFSQLGEGFMFPDRKSKVQFLKVCINELDHPIPSNILHEIENVDAVLDYFSTNVEPEDKLVHMLNNDNGSNKLPPNLVLQIDPLRFDHEDKSFFPTTAFPGRSTIVSGLADAQKYPSRRVSKDRRVRIDSEDLV